MSNYPNPYDASAPGAPPPPPAYGGYPSPYTSQDSAASYNPNGYHLRPAKTNALAIFSLVSAFVISLAAVILGHIALKQIGETGEQGRGLAIAGLALGYAGLAFGAMFWGLVFLGALMGPPPA